MADENRLTVAELLARNSKEEKDSENTSSSAKSAEEKRTPRRRRRRNLEEGGVSVAELTGSIKRVDAAPAHSKHSHKDDSPAPVIPAPKTAEGSPKADKPEAENTPKPEKEETQTKAAPSESVAADKDTSVSKDATDKQSGMSEEDAEDSDNKVVSPADNETAVIQKVAAPTAEESAEQEETAEPKESAKDAGPAAAEHKDAEPLSPETTVIPAQSAKDAPGTSPKDKSEQATSVAVKEAEDKKTLPAEEDEQLPESEDTGKSSAVSIVVLALVGIILGAVVFKGFEILWGRFDRIIVSVLAVAVTAVMVGVIHVLRTSRDVASMFLAAVVGLILTFGPLLIILL